MFSPCFISLFIFPFIFSLLFRRVSSFLFHLLSSSLLSILSSLLFHLLYFIFSLPSCFVLCFIFSLLLYSCLVLSLLFHLLLYSCLVSSSPVLSMSLSASVSVSVSVSVWCCGRVVVLCCVLCSGVRVVVCVCVCVVVVLWRCGVSIQNLRVSIQNVPVCTFRTSPCVPAPRAHVFQHAHVLLAPTERQLRR